jgi:hypothetical protein
VPREKQQEQENNGRYSDGKAISHHRTILEGLRLDDGKRLMQAILKIKKIEIEAPKRAAEK